MRRTAALRLSLLGAGLLSGVPALALDYGPFSLNGFAKVEFQRGTHICEDCQREPNENRQRLWADDIVYGKRFGTESSHLTLVQPYLGVKQTLGQGFKAFGLWSQRWRDGKVDLPGWLYERNAGVEHEDYGRLTIGSMPTRSWSLADYPFGTHIGVSDAWASSGAGYGLLGHALRYQSRKLDFLEGDLVLEATYDKGKSGWRKNKPRFVEVFAQFVKRDLVVDAVLQVTRNGEPVAWGHAPFGGLTPFPRDDDKLGSSGQSIAMAMARYQLDANFELLGGLRLNRWSGAYAVQTTPGAQAQWNNMFNVDWGGTKDGVPNPGYSARSTDVVLGLRYRTGAWTASTGLLHLGQARTANPSERGQSNALTLNTVGLSYDVGQGLNVYGTAGMAHYKRKGLAPLSMPAHNAFTNIDSRTAKSGNWVGVGAVYTF